MQYLSRLIATPLALAVCSAVSLAHASTISIGLSTSSDPTTASVLATDSVIAGLASYQGYFNNGITANNISATGYPVRSSGNLSTTSVSVSKAAGTASAGTLYVYITEQGLTTPTGLINFISGFTSNDFTGAATSGVETTYYSNANALFSGTEIATYSFSAADTVLGQGTALYINPATLLSPFSETVVYAITFGGNGGGAVNETVNLSTAVTPEPSSLALLGTGLVGAATMALRRRQLMA